MGILCGRCCGDRMCVFGVIFVVMTCYVLCSCWYGDYVCVLCVTIGMATMCVYSVLPFVW